MKKETRWTAALIVAMLLGFALSTAQAASRDGNRKQKATPIVVDSTRAAANDSTMQAAPDTAIVAEAAGLKSAIGDSRPDISWSISAGKVFWSLVIFAIAWVVVKYSTKLLETVAERRSNWRLGIKATIPVLRIGAWTLVIYLIVARIFAPPIQTLLALTASAGIAVGFAAQDILKNIFGGITILFDRPFQVGDKIRVKEYYGEVVSIGLRTVRIVTPDDSLVSIPNSELVNQSVSNANAGSNSCQVVAEFWLPPHVDVEAVKRIAFRAAAVSKFVYVRKPIAVVVLNEIQEGRSLLKLRLKAYVFDLRYEFPFASEMTETVMTTLLKEGFVKAEDLALLGQVG